MRDVHQRATSLASRYSQPICRKLVSTGCFAEDGEELGFAHWRHIAPLADARGSARTVLPSLLFVKFAHEEGRTRRRAGAGAGSF